MQHDYPLLTVTVVALASMMLVQVFGIYVEAIFPSAKKQVTYECDFHIGKVYMTAPCTIRGVYGNDE